MSPEALAHYTARIEAAAAALEMPTPDEECVWAWAAHELERMVPRREEAKARAQAKERAVRAFLRSDELTLGETMPKNRYPVNRLRAMAREEGGGEGSQRATGSGASQEANES